MRKNPPARAHSHRRGITRAGEHCRRSFVRRQDATAFFAAAVYTGVKRKQRRVGELWILIMLLCCVQARVRPGRRHCPLVKPPAQQEVFHMYRLSDAQNRSSTTFGGTSSSAGLCMNIFIYLNEEAWQYLPHASSDDGHSMFLVLDRLALAVESDRLCAWRRRR